jgi:hypothetical protein
MRQQATPLPLGEVRRAATQYSKDQLFGRICLNVRMSPWSRSIVAEPGVSGPVKNVNLFTRVFLRVAVRRTAKSWLLHSQPSPGPRSCVPGEGVSIKLQPHSSTRSGAGHNAASSNGAAQSPGGPRWGRNSAEPGGQQRTAGDNEPRGQQPFTALGLGRETAGVNFPSTRSAMRRRCPHAGGVPGPRLVHTPSVPSGPQRSPAVSSGRLFAQVADAILRKQARGQNPDKDEVPILPGQPPHPVSGQVR